MRNQKRTWDKNLTSIRNETQGTLVATAVDVATSFAKRGRGLMLRDDFPDGHALIIDPCSSIHMFFMRFPIDVLYMDASHTVVRAQQGIKPWRMGPLRTPGAKYVIELPEGTIESTQTTVGDRISYH